MNLGVVVVIGFGVKLKDGILIFCDVKSGDIVFLLEYGGILVKL